MDYEKTCADCMFFAQNPKDGSNGACLETLEPVIRVLGMTIPCYYATNSGKEACPSFEPKEDGR